MRRKNPLASQCEQLTHGGMMLLNSGSDGVEVLRVQNLESGDGHGLQLGNHNDLLNLANVIDPYFWGYPFSNLSLPPIGFSPHSISVVINDKAQAFSADYIDISYQYPDFGDWYSIQIMTGISWADSGSPQLIFNNAYADWQVSWFSGMNPSGQITGFGSCDAGGDLNWGIFGISGTVLSCKNPLDFPPTAINNNGEVTGGYSYSPGPAKYWYNGNEVQLGTSGWSRGNDINDAKIQTTDANGNNVSLRNTQIVGFDNDLGAAVLWQTGTAPSDQNASTYQEYNLNDLIPQIVTPSGTVSSWNLYNATSINDSGVIFCWGNKVDATSGTQIGPYNGSTPCLLIPVQFSVRTVDTRIPPEPDSGNNVWHLNSWSFPVTVQIPNVAGITNTIKCGMLSDMQFTTIISTNNRGDTQSGPSPWLRDIGYSANKVTPPPIMITGTMQTGGSYTWYFGADEPFIPISPTLIQHVTTVNETATSHYFLYVSVGNASPVLTSEINGVYYKNIQLVTHSGTTFKVQAEDQLGATATPKVGFTLYGNTPSDQPVNCGPPNYPSANDYNIWHPWNPYNY